MPQRGPFAPNLYLLSHDSHEGHHSKPLFRPFHVVAPRVGIIACFRDFACDGLPHHYSVH